MPAPETSGRPPRVFPGLDAEPYRREVPGDFWPPPPASPAIGPGEVLAAVRAMDAGQRAELARLLGVQVRSPYLYLPDTSGGFSSPACRGIGFNAAQDPAPGWK
jgi:hypothetical protein